MAGPDKPGKRGKTLGELVVGQRSARRVRVQTGTHSSQLDYARRFAQPTSGPQRARSWLSVAGHRLEVRAPTESDVRAGLPPSLLDELCQCLGLEREALAEVLRIDSATLAPAPSATAVLDVGTSARIAELLRVLARAAERLGSDRSALVTFMTTARGDPSQTALQRCATSAGVRELLAELDR